MGHHRNVLLPIGIHLAADAVAMVQLSQAEGGMRLVSKAEQQFPTAVGSESAPVRGASEVDESRYAAAREFVRQTIATDGFRGREAVISLPPEHLTIQHARVAPSQPDELSATLLAALQGKLPFDPRQAVIRHIVTGTVSDGGETRQDVIVLAAHRAAVEKHVAAFSRLGLRVVGVGAEPCAMCYAFAHQIAHLMPAQDTAPAVMVVYLGQRLTYVSIVKGQDITFVKGVDLGTDEVVEAIAKARKCEPAEAAALRKRWLQNPADGLPQAIEVYNSVRWCLEHFTDEIESCMRYHASLARGARVDKLFFVGPEAKDKALVRVLASRLTVPCEVGDPLKAVTGTETGQDGDPQLSVAVGLSLFTAP